MNKAKPSPGSDGAEAGGLASLSPVLRETGPLSCSHCGVSVDGRTGPGHSAEPLLPLEAGVQGSGRGGQRQVQPGPWSKEAHSSSGWVSVSRRPGCEHPQCCGKEKGHLCPHSGGEAGKAFPFLLPMPHAGLGPLLRLSAVGLKDVQKHGLPPS